MNQKKIYLFGAIFLFLVSFFVLFTKPEQIAFINGKIYTVETDLPWAEAILMEDGRISEVGSNDLILQKKKKSARVIDLKGKMVLPGFHDSHAHILEGGYALGLCNLNSLKSIEEYKEKIKECAVTQKDKKWITGFGWKLSLFPNGNPSKEIIDSVVLDKPVGFVCNDGHSYWVNSKALEIANITKDTPDPSDGRIERDANGNPTGTLRDGAMELIRPYAFEPSPLDALKGLEDGVALANSFGITSFIDARTIIADKYDLLYRLANFLGKLNARVTLALYLDPKKDESQISDLIAKFDNNIEGRVKADQIKIFMDGVTEAKTAALIDPYENDKSNSGILTFAPEVLQSYVLELTKAGFQMHIHAIGDRGVREGLNTLESVHRITLEKQLRHHLVHLYLISPKDITRFKEMGVTANIQPNWASNADWNQSNLENLGRKRYFEMFPFKSLQSGGVRIAAGTDWPVDILNPLEEIQVAITRREIGQDNTALPLNEKQALDLKTILEAYTINGAYLQRRETITGSLKKGKYADLVILDQNLFAISPYQIYKVKVLATLLEGEFVFNILNE